MSYSLLSETRPIARKQHRCIWCGQAIEIGTRYVAERSVFDGEMQNHHWHEECLSMARDINEGGEWEFEPYGNERGAGAPKPYRLCTHDELKWGRKREIIGGKEIVVCGRCREEIPGAAVKETQN